MNNKKLSVIEEIVGWKHQGEDSKLYFIQSYLLGWNTEDAIHAITESDQY